MMLFGLGLAAVARKVRSSSPRASAE
ncbi:MAG: hypothetical protein K2Y23_09185 [Cyanobacteria bacterium]|nr:hypothetical protein [Cyanobacteriota bacterium]